MQKTSSEKVATSDKMASSSDPSKSSNSALTNVAPPSALPSFLTSPLPSAAPPSAPPSGPSPPPNAAVPPGQSFRPGSSLANVGNTNIGPARGQPFPPPGTSPVPPYTSPTPTTTSSSLPTLRTNTSQPPGHSPTPPGPVLTPATGPSSSANVPSEAPAFPPSPSNSADPGMGSQSFQPPQPYYTPAPSSGSPVTSQPQPPNSHSSATATASVDLGSPGVVTSSKRNEGPGWFGWIRGTVSTVGHRVAERAKTSMDSMITTLDPQMKEFIHSGGDMDIIVASDKEVKVGAMREAFQMVFGKATVCGMKAEAQGVAAQPVGFEAALTSAEMRINFLRSSGQIHPQQPIVAVENFIVEFHSDCWFDLGLLLLDDPGEDILLQTYTQVTPIPPDFITQARNATPEDYPFKDSGFAVTVGQIASQSLQVHHTMWQENLTSVSRREALMLAGRTLAGIYRSRLPSYH